ncbi:MAG: hypothetical protein HYZ63_02900 [Candidatus Andersenbacteria bacterium]|nr:hypothetical protein [Candidatus Andersenbacteria bacterium]
MIAIIPVVSAAPLTFGPTLVFLAPYLLAGGWLVLFMFTLWIVWETYRLLKAIDYVSAQEWSFIQITLPADAVQTPKAMEVAYNVWDGLHKNPDLIEKYFDGYLEAWYSCELQCTMGTVRYIMVVPTNHRRFFEGVIYGQYANAEIKEVEDYTLKYSWRDNGKKFNMYGTEIVLTKPDIYPIKTYVEYEDKFAEDDRFIDPHQSLVEAYTNVGPGEEYWVQICIRPIAGSDIEKWSKEGAEEVAKISGQAKKTKETHTQKFRAWLFAWPGEVLNALLTGKPIEAEESKDDKPALRFFNPIDSAKMESILQKTTKQGFRVKIRIIYIAPLGQLHKPNISRAIGAFKQFNTYHSNSFKPDELTKTNGPNYFMKASRRAFRERNILLNFQWRDMWGYDSGQMMSAEELATLYHFPAKTVQAPNLERAKSGLKSAPENLPYV